MPDCECGSPYASHFYAWAWSIDETTSAKLTFCPGPADAASSSPTPTVAAPATFYVPIATAPPQGGVS